ncbi:MAG: hypothetical protein H8K06_18940 [Nitrospira sp.]|uniref:Response regulatory domain-containing protein n=1 Tax=Nitrospira defluvii TaxID=330214 RepID=A0ABN7MBF1_9BACT|nr:hypothetical protein [Nitrospira defluvii]MCS6329139.1 hypothetical protein [Nitrospira sp.]CAE6789153.1 Response regulatory domain-containing protein [Nitrospira defluvii]
MSATSIRTKPAGRTRIMIVDPELQLGLKLADHLARNGYQAVLVRDLESTLAQLGEIRPEIILLSQDSSMMHPPAVDIEALRIINTLCPQAPVLRLNRSLHGTMPFTPLSPDSPHASPPPALQPHVVEDVLRAQLGIPCMRVQ